MQSRATVGEGRGAQGAISLNEQDPWPFQTTSFLETTCNLKKIFFIKKNRVCTIQSHLASREAPSLLSRSLGDPGGATWPEETKTLGLQGGPEDRLLGHPLSWKKDSGVEVEVFAQD